MCTAITFKNKDHYFGRNLDLEYRYRENVVITPREFPLPFKTEGAIKSHFAMIGMATIIDNYPLYYDATNEHGLSMAGLNFPGNAAYTECKCGSRNVTPFEFTPWILAQCKSVGDVESLLNDLRLVNIPFSDSLPLSPLHWIIADNNRAITVEPTSNGLMVYPNPVGVLTNNPPFPYHLYHLTNYINITSAQPQNRFSSALELAPYSRGMGAIGLPGDLSSQSRFVRAAFTKWNSVCNSTESDTVSQFFHILNSVVQQRGCVQVGKEYEITLYQSCCNTDKGIYYYKTYTNSQITAVDLHQTDLNTDHLIVYPLRETQNFFYETQKTGSVAN